MAEAENGTIQIREARLDDLEAITALLDQLKQVTSQHNLPDPASVLSSMQTMLHFPDVYRNYLSQGFNQDYLLLGTEL